MADDAQPATAGPAEPAPPLPDARPKELAKTVGHGVLMGLADVVPGVSGGTVAFILGITERIVDALRRFDGRLLRALLEPFRAGRKGLDALTLHLRRIDVPFLVALATGIGLTLLLAARFLSVLLEEQPVMMLALFFGFVVASLVVPWHRMTRHGPRELGAILLGAAFGFWFVGLEAVQSPQGLWFIPVAGALAICAMILPGISGAFLLVILGLYARMLQAVVDLDVEVILLFVLGALVGIIAFSRVLHLAFSRFPNPTLAVLTGVMAGSLRKVWPFKDDYAGEFASGHNVLPDFGAPIFGVALVAFLLGVAIVATLETLARIRTAPTKAA